MNATHYDGNATAFDWVLDKGDILNTNSSGGELGMLLTEANGGTRLSSTRYVHYGTITARRTYLLALSCVFRLIAFSVKTGRWENKGLRHLEDVVDSSETRGGCTDEANMVEGCGVGEDCLIRTRARLLTAI